MPISTEHGKILELDVSKIGSASADLASVSVLKALGSEVRLYLLEVLGPHTLSINQLAENTDLPPTTVAMHVKILEEAGLLHSRLKPATRGLQKVCSRTHDKVIVRLPPLEYQEALSTETAMPIGAYVDFAVAPRCGLASDTALIGMMDDPPSFLEPEHLSAQILWFTQGFVEYRFPNRVPIGARAKSLQLRMEVCSEAPMHNDDWPSDITLWLNGVDVGTWTCPSDFGGTRGVNTPSWWLTTDSQFGLLKRWEVSRSGSFIDGVQLSDVTLEDLKLEPKAPITVRLGVKPDARHVGGLNLFGRKFGNYPEDIVLRVTYET